MLAGTDAAGDSLADRSRSDNNNVRHGQFLDAVSPGFLLTFARCFTCEWVARDLRVDLLLSLNMFRLSQKQ